MRNKNNCFSSLFLPWDGKRLKLNVISLFCSALALLFFSGRAVGTPIDIADIPLDSQLSAAAPNLMFGLDDSGSMDWEILTTESDGLFNISNTHYEYVFDNPGDNLYTSGTNSSVITGSNRAYWKSQWSDYNVMYYNPKIDYKPWQGFPDENVTRPRSHPYYNSTAPQGNQLNAAVRPKPYTSNEPPAVSSPSTRNCLELQATYWTINSIDIKNAHYYTWNDANGNGTVNTGEIYLVNLDGAKTYYQLNGDNDNKVESGELSITASPPAGATTSRTYAQELQNFANWYTFYRKRRLTATTAIANVIPKLQGVNVGFRSINGHIIKRVMPINVGGFNYTDDLLDLLFSYHQGTHTTGSTPLRLGTENIGKYYDTIQTITPAEPELATSPIELGPSGECQQNFTIMFTDGAYNGNSPGLGNVDSGMPAPYGDTASNTLADVTMFYWKRDLAPTVDNKVPTNFYDSANWQHMVTYVVSFGLVGNLNPANYDLYNINPALRIYPTWPSPINSDKERLDDLWHAAVNGRGKYLSAKNPQALIDAFDEVINDVIARIGSGASVSINGEELHAGSVVYQSRYATDGWTGDVMAYGIDPVSGAVILNPPKWSASEELDNAQIANASYWDTVRIIATYNDSTSAGIPFRYSSLSAGQQAIINADMVNYLRGNPSLEQKNGGVYRDRMLKINGVTVRQDTMLGDIVHSAPLYHNNVIYVGANDGMLHAFNADTGKELFAYVPNLVFSTLPQLTNPIFSHKFYVDLTPFAKTIDTGASLATLSNQDILVGGLGKGGKGYYCIDVTDLVTNDADPLSITTEAQLATKIKWEYPNASTPIADTADMGYTFSRAIVVRSNLSTIANNPKGWVVIYGNGYNSTNESAVLFVLDAVTGTLLKKIDTGFNPSNGLSTPAPVDVDGNYIVDYVYAGDLQGNMWKFDLTSNNVANWEVSYSTASIPKPLFRAMDGVATPNYQPITSKPDIMFHCSKPGYLVAFGTGKYLGSSDLSNTKTQTLYGIWDYGDDADNSEYLGSFQRLSTQKLSNQPNTVELLEQTVIYQGVINNKSLRVTSTNIPQWDTVADATVGQNPDPSKDVGWYIDLPTPKERIIHDLMIRGGKVIATSIIPQTGSPCSAGGSSWLFELDACTGRRPPTPQLDITGDDIINQSDLITIPDPANPGSFITVPPDAFGFDSIVYPPVVLDVPDNPTEIKYFSTSGGSITTVREIDEGSGVYFWRDH
ncbi:MAG: PQQ-binding-like beta-propeller repeat protein [Desulfamplus sp.]|nr:PQQ-binding-like beta-propeller repeat protein [Desulfamplus sp.]